MVGIGVLLSFWDGLFFWKCCFNSFLKPKKGTLQYIRKLWRVKKIQGIFRSAVRFPCAVGLVCLVQISFSDSNPMCPTRPQSWCPPSHSLQTMWVSSHTKVTGQRMQDWVTGRSRLHEHDQRPVLCGQVSNTFVHFKEAEDIWKGRKNVDFWWNRWWKIGESWQRVGILEQDKHKKHKLRYNRAEHFCQGFPQNKRNKEILSGKLTWPRKIPLFPGK